MQTMDQIYLWKRLYWQAVNDGLDPGEARRFAYRAFCRCSTPFPALKRQVRISTSFPAVTA